jgi:hypothetical protein
LNNTFAILPGGEVSEAVLIPELGFDVGTALRFSQRLYERVFSSTRLKSRGEGGPPPPPALRALPDDPILQGRKPPARPLPEEPAPLDDSPSAP